MWTIEYTDESIKNLKKLSQKTRSRIIKALEEMAALENPLAHRHTKKLSGELREMVRLRVGGYRVIFRIEQRETILVISVLPRGKAY